MKRILSNTLLCLRNDAKIFHTILVCLCVAVNAFSQVSYTRNDIQDKMENFTHTEKDLGTVAQLYRNRQVLNNDQSEKNIALFTIVSCLRHKKYDLYEKHFSDSEFAEIVENVLKVPCSVCRGKGFVTFPCPDCAENINSYNYNGEIVTKGTGLCVDCRGQGKTRRALLTVYVYVECFKCKGTGKCQTCEGTGLIREKCKNCYCKGTMWDEHGVVDVYNHIYSMCIADLDKSRVLKSTVLIEGDISRGSGVIINFNGKQFVASNMHVLIGNEKVKLTTYEGANLEYINIYVSKNQDLALYELDSQQLYPALDIVSDDNGIRAVSMGKSVYVYGNSLGGGVITSLIGTVVGVGPEKIEVTAEFVSGNSGSPVIIDKKVAGIATYATLETGAWVTHDTRFEKVRRYAVRIDNQSISKFELLNNDLYQENLVLYRDVHVLCDRLDDIFKRKDLDAIMNQKQNIEKMVAKIDNNNNWATHMLQSDIEYRRNALERLLTAINENLIESEILAERDEHNQLVQTLVAQVLNQYLTVCQDNLSSSDLWSNPANASNIKDILSWQIRNIEVIEGIAKATVSITTSLSASSYKIYLTLTDSGWKIFKITKLS